MPTYQYRCRACGDELEVVQKFTDPSLTECPSCAGELRKVFSPVGAVFKGSGFYATDSRAPRAKETAAATSSSGDSGTKSSTSSSTTSSSTSSASTTTSPPKSASA